MTVRGDIHWLDLGAVLDQSPANRRPVVVVQSQPFNDSAIGTVVVVALTSILAAAAYPGNVFLPSTSTGLPRDSVAKVTEILTTDRSRLGPLVGQIPQALMSDIDQGLRTVLDL